MKHQLNCFRIVAYGAAGGALASLPNTTINHGTTVRAYFNLTRNDTLYALVGQMGESPCVLTAEDAFKGVSRIIYVCFTNSSLSVQLAIHLRCGASVHEECDTPER